MKDLSYILQYTIVSLILLMRGFIDAESLPNVIVFIFLLPAFIVGCTIIALEFWVQIVISAFIIFFVPWYVGVFAPWYDNAPHVGGDWLWGLIALSIIQSFIAIVGSSILSNQKNLGSLSMGYKYFRAHILYTCKSFFDEVFEDANNSL